MAEEWEVPPKFLGGIPEVAPGSSGGKPVEGDFPLDQVVIDEFPPGTVVRSCNRYGASDWTVAARIETILASGEPKSYFLKCAEYDQGRAMLEGEFHSMNELYKVAPNLVPKPHGWGQLTVSNPKTYYYLCDFIEFTGQKPDPFQLCEKLVALHKSSKSPTGMFGFHIKPLRGNLPLETTWNPDWLEFFIQLFRRSLALDQKVNGTWKDIGHLVELAIKHVVPRVLGPLGADGRSVKPSLIHGDLWGGKIGTDSKTGKIYIFDASSYYAHHEMEIAIWRPHPASVVGSGVYVKEYLAQMGISEPAEQFEDRQKLYSACTALHAAACHNGDWFREEVHDKLKYLLEKYAPGLKDACTDDAS
ncbi:Fructosamine kinase-domain-containing protein [Chaetomium tenue]|uniref:Fructosamine kinase-domain-containing protein n=1 Tax=Chaetomium tenue TaxID=1854479 RepID=A0ACB7P9D8_9PEZI|nr:Fructosamine kinase-domain-containing protein [Chaetomium globosum]